MATHRLARCAAAIGRRAIARPALGRDREGLLSGLLGTIKIAEETDQARRHAPPLGALCWNELATTDVKRAEAFFGELLGWQYETDESGYASIRNGGRLNGGIRAQTEHERGIPPNWLPCFTVENAGEASRHAEREGGRTLAPAIEIHIGRIAVIADPQGAAFAVFEGETDP